MSAVMAQEKRVYVTQYGFYWSMPVSTWIELCKTMVQSDADYNYDQMENVRLLKHKPRTVFIHKTLDWKKEEWRYGLYEEAKIILCQLCYSVTEHDPDEQCSECGGCEHCCMGDSFRDCELEASED